MRKINKETKIHYLSDLIFWLGMYAPVIAFLFFYSKDRKTLIKNIIILIAGTIVLMFPYFLITLWYACAFFQRCL